MLWKESIKKIADQCKFDIDEGNFNAIVYIQEKRKH